jgi:L-aminopeptidase/D-esterase-like protein
VWEWGELVLVEVTFAVAAANDATGGEVKKGNYGAGGVSKVNSFLDARAEF